MCPVGCSECIVDIAVSVRGKLGDEFLLAFLDGSLCSLLLLVGNIFCEASRLAFLFSVEAEVLKYKDFARLEGGNLLVS